MNFAIFLQKRSRTQHNYAMEGVSRDDVTRLFTSLDGKVIYGHTVDVVCTHGKKMSVEDT